MRLSETKVWSRRETSEEGEKLVKVIELGIHKPVLATDVVEVILQEVIKEHNRSGHVTLDMHPLSVTTCQLLSNSVSFIDALPQTIQGKISLRWFWR